MIIERHCLKCDRVNRGRRDKCLYCGGALPNLTDEQLNPQGPPPELPPPPESTLTGQDLMCPRCQVAMVLSELGGLAIGRCEACRGIFVDRPTFDYLIERQATLADHEGTTSETGLSQRVQRGSGEDLVAYLNCPVCQRQMSRNNYAKCSAVIYDACQRHGIWLDDTELQQILTFIATGGHALRDQIRRQAQAARKRHDQRIAEGRDWAVRRMRRGYFRLGLGLGLTDGWWF